MTNPLATVVIDAARAYCDAWCGSVFPTVVNSKRYDLFDALLRLNDVERTERHTLPDGTRITVDGGGVTVR